MWWASDFLRYKYVVCVCVHILRVENYVLLILVIKIFKVCIIENLVGYSSGHL